MNNVIPLNTRSPYDAPPAAVPPLTTGGGGGTSDGMEARIARLESDVGHISESIAEVKADVRELRGDLKSDFRILFGALITVAIGLAGLMAHGFKWL